MLRYFPRIGPEHISIRQIDSHEHILSAFDRTIAMYATEHFRRSGIDLILSCRVRTPGICLPCRHYMGFLRALSPDTQDLL